MADPEGARFTPPTAERFPFVRLAPPAAARARGRRRVRASAIRAGISDGMRATGTPAAWKAAIFSAAVPLPPVMMAPACPMRFPGGAL